MSIEKFIYNSTGESIIRLRTHPREMVFENEAITLNSFEYKLVSPYKIDETTEFPIYGFETETITRQTITVDNEATTA